MRIIRWMPFLALVPLSFLPISCGNKAAPPTTPAPVTVVATQPPNTVAGRDWNYATLNAAFPARYAQTALTYNNAMWIIGGISGAGNVSNDVWTSTDGKNWTNVLANTASPGSSQFSQRQELAGVVFNNKMWVIGGGNTTALNDVWSSSDGVNWTNVLPNNASPGTNQFPGRFAHSVLAYNNLIYVIGGDNTGNNLNDVWSSPDGVTWTKLLSNAASPGGNQFSQRDAFGAVVFNNTMWVVAGFNGTNGLNDTWSSTNGSSWTNVLANASSPAYFQFPQRAGETVLAYNNVMWVIGGESNAGPDYNDVWYSANGLNWAQMTASAAFPARFGQSGLVYNNAMWIMAGLTVSYLNDVWYSPF